MQAKLEPSSQHFLWHVEQIARYKKIPPDSLLYDIWFDFFLWKNRRSFEGGPINLLGNFSKKTNTILSSFGNVLRIDNLNTLTQIPQSYALMLDFDNQAYTRHHFFDEFGRHFEKSRTPPPIFLVGRYRGKDTLAGHVLTIKQAGDSIDVKITSALAASFKLGHCSTSMPASNLSESAPYVMFGCQIQFTAIG